MSMAYEINLLTTISIQILFAIGLSVIVGLCGQISLGHAAFFGVGAYTAAMLTRDGVPFPLAILPAMLTAGGIGVFVGLTSLRVREDFLAITTMGFGFLFIGVVRQQEWLGGEMGLSGIPSHGLGSVGFLLLCAGLALAAAMGALWLKRSWMGFVFQSVADDEDTVQLLGISVANYKLAAFAIGTGAAGIAGALYAHHVRFIDPISFGFLESVTVLAVVIVGGVRSIGGVTLAAALLAVMPQMFQWVEEFKLLIYGALLFVVMRFFPAGIAGLFTLHRKRS